MRRRCVSAASVGGKFPFTAMACVMSFSAISSSLRNCAARAACQRNVARMRGSAVALRRAEVDELRSPYCSAPKWLRPRAN